MIKYRIDVLAELAKVGYNRKQIRKVNFLSQATLTAIKNGGNINTETLNKLCLVLRLQPSDILEVVPTDEEKMKYF